MGPVLMYVPHHTRRITLALFIHIIIIIIMCCVLHHMYHIPAEVGMSILIIFKLSSEFTDSLEYRKYYCNVKIAQHPSIHTTIHQ